MVADRTVRVRYDAVVDGYVRGMAKMRTSTTEFAASAEKSASKNTAAWSSMGSKVGAAGIALGLGIGVAVKRFADFDQEMSAAQAATRATGSSMDSLRTLAIQLGADSQFSAREAAQGITEMGKAGVATADILGGGLKGALDLAAAGQMSVARAAEVSAVALQQFGLQGRDLPHVADLFAAAAGKAVGSVDDIANAMKYAGVTASSMGISVEETSGVLALFASKGIIGEQAGTSFRSMLMSLTSPSMIAKKAMDDLGISMYDSTGQFVGMDGAAQILQDRLGGLDEATRNAALGKLFDNTAMSAAVTLYESGAAGVQKWTKAVDDSGFASRQAAALTNNLMGDVERLGGALDSVFIKSGSGANDALRGLVESLTSVVGWIGDLPDGVQQAGLQLGILATASLLAGGAFLKMGAAAATAKTELVAMGLSAGTASKAMKMAGVAVGIAAIAAVTAELQQMIAAASITDVKVGDLADSLDQLDSTRLSGGIADLFRDNGGWLQASEGIVTTSEALKRFGTAANDALGDSLTQKAARLTSMGAATGKYEKYVKSLDAAFAQMVSSGNGEQAQQLLEKLLSGVDPENVDEVRASFKLMDEALLGVKDGALAADPALKGLDSSQRAAALSAQSAATATSDWAKELQDLNSPLLDARAAARDFEAAIDDASAALRTNGETLNIATKKGRENQAALDAVASSAIAQISALQANGASQGELQSKLERSRDRLITVAESFGMSKKEAEAYADQVLDVPTAVHTKVIVDSENAATKIRTIDTMLNNINGKWVTTHVVTAYSSTGSRPMAGGFTRDEDGGIHVAPTATFADSGIALGTGRSVARTSQVASGTGGIMWQEPVTGWEAYISGKPGARGRSRVIMDQIAPKLGLRVVEAANGGTVGTGGGTAGGGLSPSQFAALLGQMRSALTGLVVVADGRELGRLQHSYDLGYAR